jgi:guanylate kinase
LPERGLLFVMTGASGVGKDTIRQAALGELSNLHYSISATTRPMRAGEQAGLHYTFVEHSEFRGMLEQDLLLEYAEYVGDYYGTPLLPVVEQLEAGVDVLVELELVGARQVKKRLPEAIMLFIAPPSLVELERRLRGRGTDSEEKIQKRLARAREEMRAIPEFDYLIVNDRLSDAVSAFQSIIRAERLRVARLSAAELADLMQGGTGKQAG